ncbi:MAG: DUF3772 domain-containing protein [Pseudomonadota bacterium]
MKYYFPLWKYGLQRAALQVPCYIFVLIWALLALASASGADTTAAGQTAGEEVPGQALKKVQQTNLFPAQLAESIPRQADALDLLRKSVERLRNNVDELEHKRRELQQLKQQMSATKSALAPRLSAVDGEISQLGKAPEAPGAVEAPEIVEERDHLNSIRASIVAAQKRTDLSILRAQNLEEQIQEYQLQNFTSDILRRSRSPVSGALWRNLDDALPRVLIQIKTIAGNWWAIARLNPISLSLALIIGISCYVLLVLARQRIFKSMESVPTAARPGFLHRAMRASLLAFVLVMPGMLAAVAIFVTGELLHLWDDTIRKVAYSALTGFLIFLFVTALATGILQPQWPNWRLVGIPTNVAQRLLWTINAIAAVYAADLFLHHMIQLFHMPVEIRILETSLANGAFAVLLIVLALTALPDDYERASARLIKISLNILRVPLGLVALTIIIVTLAGYVALGRFIAGQVLLMGAGGVAVLLLHLGIRVMAANPHQLGEPLGRLISEGKWLSQQRWQKIFDIIAFFANVFLITIALTLLLLSWGIPFSQLLNSLKSLLFGFEIGQFRISLVNILMGVGLFAAVLLITRMVQGWVDRSVLNAPNVDRGIANSLHTGLGYLGFAAAALVGISYIGIDLTQLTLVIGALSLGVGLGLQSIVNNFVSGLILLVERPVKVGDWVVVGDQQGYVRKISVRSTEIETFDRASVIIPNATLIGGTVQNWTHRSPMGRIVIPVGVSYQSDPQEVHDLLMNIAKTSDKVLGFPEPFVTFDDFGTSSLNFSLRCYVSDINSGLLTKTVLRMEIFKMFQERGIEIPYPQQDLHLRDLDGIKAIFAKAQQQLTVQAGSTDSENSDNNDGEKK